MNSAPEVRHHSVAAWLHKCDATGLADEPVTNACSAVLSYRENDGGKLQQKQAKIQNYTVKLRSLVIS